MPAVFTGPTEIVAELTALHRAGVLPLPDRALAAGDPLNRDALARTLVALTCRCHPDAIAKTRWAVTLGASTQRPHEQPGG